MKKNRNLPLLIWIVVTLLVASACNFFAAASTPQPGSQAAYTQAASTMAALLTQQAYNNLAAELTRVASGAASTPTPTLPATLPPSAIPPTPTATTVPPTPVPPTATPIPIPCNHAEFVKDVTVPDGTSLPPGEEFIKVWRLKNIGSCTWDRDYSLVFVSGDRMNASRSVPIGDTVRPGEKIDVSVDYVAPDHAGRYRSLWMLSNASDKVFGIGKNADRAFWTQIQVASPNEAFAYDLATNMCLATWRSDAGSLPCPGPSGSEEGSVILLNRPDLETGRREDELTIWMRPEQTSDGWISGTYPEYKVKDGDHFLADIGCLEGNSGCDVTFSLEYQVSGGSPHNLGEWDETYDGSIRRVDVDLSSLADRRVRLILSVTNQGRASKANAFWLAPSVRKGSPVVSVPAVQAARQRVADDLVIDVTSVSVQSYEPAEWTDSCLGVHLQDQVCADVIIPGYQVVLSTGNGHYEAHTNQDGSIVFWFEL
jgi:hypothetical protein